MRLAGFHLGSEEVQQSAAILRLFAKPIEANDPTEKAGSTMTIMAGIQTERRDFLGIPPLILRWNWLYNAWNRYLWSIRRQDSSPPGEKLSQEGGNNNEWSGQNPAIAELELFALSDGSLSRFDLDGILQEQHPARRQRIARNHQMRFIESIQLQYDQFSVHQWYAYLLRTRYVSISWGSFPDWRERVVSNPYYQSA